MSSIIMGYFWSKLIYFFVNCQLIGHFGLKLSINTSFWIKMIDQSQLNNQIWLKISWFNIFWIKLTYFSSISSVFWIQSTIFDQFWQFRSHFNWFYSDDPVSDDNNGLDFGLK